jgi:hypothetical protein
MLAQGAASESEQTLGALAKGDEAPEGRQMDDVPPKQLIASYDRGMITGHDLVFRLIQAAAIHEPEEILPLVPEELLAEVRDRGLKPPARPEDMRFFQSVCNSGPHDSAAWEREQQTTYYEGAWRWYRFLTHQQG